MENRHVTADLLEDFLSVRLSREESAKVVRHILSGCPVCAPLTICVARLHPVLHLSARKGSGVLPHRGRLITAATFFLYRLHKRSSGNKVSKDEKCQKA